MTSNDWAPPPLIPPFRFGTVEHEVYRGAYPKQRNLRFLKRLKLRTVLSLIPDAVDNDFLQFCEEQGIRWIHLPVDKVKDNVPLTYNRTVEAIQVIIDPENMPIYIHCLDGACVTGLVIACIRKLQTWNISSALGEFLRYLRGGVISSEESVFVEKFASEIEIARPIPSWLWEGQITFKRHPTLKITFKLPPDQLAATNHPRYSGGMGVVGAVGSTSLSTQHREQQHLHHHQQQQQQSQQHVAFSVPGSQQGSRLSRHHQSSSSVSSVLGFQSPLDSGAAGSTFSSSLGISQSLETVTTGGKTPADLRDTSTSDSRTSFSTVAGSAAPTASLSASSHHPTLSAISTTAKEPHHLRVGRTKSGVRSEPASQRPTSVSTPTTATMKEGLGRRPSLLHGQTGAADFQTPVSSLSSASSSSAAAAGMSSQGVGGNGGGGGGGGVGDRGTGASATVRGATSDGSKEAPIDPAQTSGEGVALGAPGSEASSTRMSPMPTFAHDNTSSTNRADNSDQRGSSAAEADEYYDVSLTLKALSLEGADW